jgi:hypothetical protein
MTVRRYRTRKPYGNVRSLQKVHRNTSCSITHFFECTVYPAQKIISTPCAYTLELRQFRDVRQVSSRYKWKTYKHHHLPQKCQPITVWLLHSFLHKRLYMIQYHSCLGLAAKYVFQNSTELRAVRGYGSCPLVNCQIILIVSTEWSTEEKPSFKVVLWPLFRIFSPWNFYTIIGLVSTGNWH